ncbi:Leucine-rich repeat-containing protein 63 [Sciurus carolinensis]|uniref:Leucine-rich repeat-containing protein 63 n=1 Tax=Sciurus carolinensis TaxID=30640 RepID=A0AA41NIS1_SCICA|nr:Leucine-rich repeat-containing protein 63 [Sciurus carolinensis]
MLRHYSFICDIVIIVFQLCSFFFFPCIAKTREIEPLHVKFTQGETTPVKKKTNLPDVSAEEQSQAPINIQTISLDHNVQERVTEISTSQKSTKDVRSLFIPSYVLLSARIFKKNIGKIKKSSEKSTTKLPKVEDIFMDKKLEDILILSSKFSQSSIPLLDSKHSHHHFPRSSESTTRSAVFPRRLASASSKVATLSKVMLSITQFPSNIVLPTPILPRKPQKQSLIENLALESGKKESVPRLLEGGSRYKRTESENILRGEGFKTVEATQYETIVAMANMAVVICQVHGRNALNLKILCLKNLQILKMRNNPIKEIPSEIQYLKYLRIFSIAFNYIHVLPYGLFSLAYLEELDVSYNEITSIPNEIQRLRSLDKLIIDGNYLFFLPPGILKLNLTKIQFENTFTHRSFWPENSLNSPQRLTHICALFIVKNDLLSPYDEIPLKVQRLLVCTSRCEWCLGPKYGEGFRIIQSYNIFGAAELPVMFHVCSLSCYRKIKESGFVWESSVYDNTD